MPPCVAVVDRYIIPGLQKKFNQGHYFCAEGTLLSARTESNQRCARGVAPTNTSPQAGVHSHHTPWTPVHVGRPPGGWARAFGGSKHKTLLPSCLGGTGPFPGWNRKAPALYGHRLLWYNRGSWAAVRGDHRRTQQVGRHQAVYVRRGIIKF